MLKPRILLCVLCVSLAVWLASSYSIAGSTHANHGSNWNGRLKSYDLGLLVSTLHRICGKETGCLLDELSKITKEYGPQASLSVLSELQAKKIISPAIEDHHVAHAIGRQTAEHFGINQEAFLLCPLSAYNGGCQHGFFQYVLGRTASSAEAADLICKSLDASFSAKFKFYCYHGIGHGIMMAQAYDLERSLAVCDALSKKSHTEGCWQGVFMESVNGVMRGEARPGIFSETEPLRPCDRVEDKYRYQCFINHAGWLMKVLKNDMTAASLSCLQAPSNYINSCLQGLGLMVTNPSWQPTILNRPPDKSVNELAVEICAKFPSAHRDQCIIGAVDNIMNFNELSIGQAAGFCGLLDAQHESLCYEKIGSSLRSQTNDKLVIARECNTLKESKKGVCMKGAGL